MIIKTLDGEFAATKTQIGIVPHSQVIIEVENFTSEVPKLISFQNIDSQFTHTLESDFTYINYSFPFLTDEKNGNVFAFLHKVDSMLLNLQQKFDNSLSRVQNNIEYFTIPLSGIYNSSFLNIKPFIRAAMNIFTIYKIRIPRVMRPSVIFNGIFTERKLLKSRNILIRLQH